MAINTTPPETKVLETSLEEIKETCHNIATNGEYIKKEIDNLRVTKHLSLERISSKVETMLRGISNINFVLQDLTLPKILCAYRVSHPGLIDTTPIDCWDELTKVSSEIQAEIEERVTAFAQKMQELTEDRDSIQSLSDYANVLKELRDEIVSRRERLEALKQRRKNADRDSQEQKNAAILIVKIKSIIEVLERFSQFVLDSFFAKRHRIIVEARRTTFLIEKLYAENTLEFKEKIPAASSSHRISSAIKELSEIDARHIETHNANVLVNSGNMSALERRTIMAKFRTKA